MVQILPKQEGPFDKILSAVGQGAGKGIERGFETQALQDILSKSDFTKDPHGFLAGIMGDPRISRQTSQDIFSGIGSLQSLELGQQNMEFKRQNQELLKKKIGIEDEARYEESVRRVGQDLQLPSDKIDWLINTIDGAKTYDEMIKKAKPALKNVNKLYDSYFSLVERHKGGIPKAKQQQANNILNKLTAYDEAKVYQGLEDRGITDIKDQLKFTSSISGNLNNILKALPKKPSAGYPFGNISSSKISERKNKISQTLAPHITPNFPVGLVVKRLQKMGYDEGDIFDIFDPYLGELSPRQQEELSAVTKRSLSDMFKGIFR